MLKSVTLEDQADEVEKLHPLRPVGATADLILERAGALDDVPLVYIAQTTRRAQDILEVLTAFAPDKPVAYFPPWDCLPGDRMAPSRSAMGRRMSVLRWLTDAKKRPNIVVATAEALIRRVPPASVWKKTHLELRVGETIDQAALQSHLERIGYTIDDRVDEPGEVAFRGRVIDLFPAAAPLPCRVEHENGTITSIRAYDPSTQRSFAPVDMLIVDPANEVIGAEGAVAQTDTIDLSTRYKRLASFFDYVPDAVVIMEEGVDRRASDFYRAVEEARSETDERAAQAIARSFLPRSEWSTAMGGRLDAVVEEDAEEEASQRQIPHFAETARPWDAFRRFCEPFLEKGYRIAFCAGNEAALPAFVKRAEQSLGMSAERAVDWTGVREASPGSFLSFLAPLTEGFVVPSAKLVCVTASDVVGQRAGGAVRGETEAFAFGDTEFSIGDAVVHIDHGVGVLEALETLDAQAGTEALRLRYAKDATLLVPLREIGALWRYGSAVDGLKLDSLKGDGWIERRNAVLQSIRETAEGLVALSAENARRKATPIKADPRFYERFGARFAFELTRDQSAAVDDVLADLESGAKMDRLVCGDVGFGKTEVALRAAAAVVSAGKQVAIAAPTTVLAQQHYRLFQKRFASLGVAVAQVSRLTSAADAKTIRAGLADGSIQIAVGTHALAGKGVAFHDLGLVVIDEEQRFGMRDKEKLRDLGKAAHVLTMTATPIPRTLQAGFAGLHPISVIATPPVQRRPTATRVAPFDDDEVRDMLMRERRRGGQSFVVCPRIEDIAPMAERLRALVPDLTVTVLHGKCDPAQLDEAMLAFAGGEGDVLLATNIIESGLDVPSANTMIVWRPDRFGLAQLHQLRGRVGRGSRRGMVLLACDPAHPLPRSAAKRLETLARLNRLGAGFEISMRDLDARGAGELLGEEQAGHLQLIGLSLYRHFLSRALASADGKTVLDDWCAEIALGAEGVIPADYVPEPELRIDLAYKLDRIREPADIDVLRAEIEDRFGRLPRRVDLGFRLAKLRLQCTELGIRRLDGGPKALAATFDRTDAERVRTGLSKAKGEPVRWSDHRLIDERSHEDAMTRLDLAEAFLERVAKWSRTGESALTSQASVEHPRTKRKARTAR